MMDTRSGRVAVIGDIGGHVDELYAALIDLGADAESLRLPDDLTVIQVGDLIHRGPDSPGVIELVDQIMRAQPDQWVQLLGNHEHQYLTAKPRFGWPEKLPEASADIIRAWWAEGRMVVAAAITTVTDSYVVTHAGVTAGFWRGIRSPRSAIQCAAEINALIGSSIGEPRLLRAGVMLHDIVDKSAGPVWASSGQELLPSWLESPVPMPFHQIHGHSSPYHWGKNAWWTTPEIAEHVELDHAKKHATATIGEKVIVAIDPGHGEYPALPWSPLVITGAAVSGLNGGGTSPGVQVPGPAGGSADR